MPAWNIVFGYKTEFSSFQNPIKLDQCNKKGSRSLGLFRKGKTCITPKFHRTDSVICCHSKEGKNPIIAK